MGYKIKEIREQKNMTQEELSKKSGVNRGTIVRLESNDSVETTTKTLLKIAKALNVSVTDIFFEIRV